MWKNPVATAVIGLLVGFFAGYLVGQGQPAAPSAPAANPHAGVPGAPSLSGTPLRPPEGGRTNATANPRLLERARELDPILAKDPKSYEALVEMGNIQYDLGDFTKAVGFYERARVLRDDSADVMTDLGVAYKESGNPTKALELFEKAAQLGPGHWQSLYNAALVKLFDLNDPVGAQAEVDKLRAVKGGAEGVPDLAGLQQEITKRLKK